MKKENPKIKILVAYHKDTYRFNSKILTPIHVGRDIANNETKKQLSNIIGDNTGDNISKDNPYYCELTALYWAWKNYEKLGNPDNIGLAHYRRFLELKKENSLIKRIFLKKFRKYIPLISDKKIFEYCKNYKVILPKKDFIANSKLEPLENLYEQYKSDHFIEDLELLESVIKEKFPKIYQSCRKTIYNNKFVYWCNMFIFSKEIYFEYCDFLFTTLKEVQTKIDFKKYDGYQSRVLGFLSERVLNIYIQYIKDKDKNLKILELPVLNIKEYFSESKTVVKNNFSSIKQLFSFDIFDTVITRITANPAGVFSYMEKELQKEGEYDIPKNLKNNFSYLRQETESFVRNSWRQCYSDNPYKRDEQDISIEDIYNRLQDVYKLSDKQKKYLKQLELKCEEKLIIPIEKNITKIKNLCEDETKKVILISDMYLSSEQIKKILCKIDPVFNDISIYVSSEIKKTKYTGDLYKYIKNKENIDYKNWIHTGDNYYSDIVKAKELGIQTVHFKYPNITSWEKRLLEIKTQHNLSAQIIAGLEKNHRLFFSKNEKNTFGGCYTAPLLIGYIEFIIKEAIDNNLKSLFFLARDGYLLKKMADVIIKERKLNINTHYLYSSRKAWRMPSIINKLPENFFTNQWLFDKENIHNMFDISKFLGIDWKLFSEVISEEYKNKQFQINEENINSISEYLENNINFKNLFFKINKKKRENIEKYLKQEINLNEKFGLIDFYGLGLTHNCFDRIIKTININTDYLYFTFKNESYRFNNKHTCQYQAFGHCFWILEPLLRAPHGQTLGYQEINKKIEPILEEKESKLIINWGINDYAEGMVEFVKSYENIRKKFEIDINFIDIFITHYESIWSDPFIIEMLGSIPFDIKMGETWFQEFAPRINKKQAIKYLITGKYPKELIWLDGSYIRSSSKIKKLLSLRRFINGQSKIYKPLKKIKKIITRK